MITSSVFHNLPDLLDFFIFLYLTQVVNYCKGLYSAASYKQLSSEVYNSFEGELGIGAMKLYLRKRNHCEVVDF